MVVDNASTDGSPEQVVREFPHVRLMRQSTNLGFAAGNNVALRQLAGQGTARLVLFLNPDAEILDDTLEGLLTALEADRAAVAWTPALLAPDGGFDPGVGGKRPGLASLTCHFLGLSRLPGGSALGVFLNQAVPYRKQRQVALDWLSGTALLVRREVIERVGGFPEDFFLYGEDILLGEALRPYGELRYLPAVRVMHDRGYSKTGAEQSYRALFAVLARFGAGTFRLGCARKVIWLGLSIRLFGYRMGAPFAESCRRRRRIVQDQLTALNRIAGKKKSR